MEVFNNILDEIKSDLTQCPEFASIKFISSDNTNATMPNPIANTHVSLSICSINIVQGSFNCFLGAGENGDRYGNCVDMNVEMKIFCPRELGGSKCFDVFAQIYERLIYFEKNYKIKSVACSQVKYDDEIFSFVLDCNLKLNLFVGYETEDINISGIVVKKKSEG